MSGTEFPHERYTLLLWGLLVHGPQFSGPSLSLKKPTWAQRVHMRDSVLLGLSVPFKHALHSLGVVSVPGQALLGSCPISQAFPDVVPGQSVHCLWAFVH